MALKIATDLKAVPNPFSPPGPIELRCTMRDDEAKPDGSVSHTFTLRLNQDNKLTFEGGLKSVSRTKTIEATALLVTFSEKINGPKDLFGFNVALFEGPKLLTSVDVTVG